MVKCEFHAGDMGRAGSQRALCDLGLCLGNREETLGNFKSRGDSWSFLWSIELKTPLWLQRGGGLGGAQLEAAGFREGGEPGLGWSAGGGERWKDQ